MNLRPHILTASCTAFVLAAPAHAQDAGTLRGVVTDRDFGGAVAGATVVVTPFKGPGTAPGTGTVTVAVPGGPTVTAPFAASVTVDADSGAEVTVDTTVGGTALALSLRWTCTSVWPAY